MLSPIKNLYAILDNNIAKLLDIQKEFFIIKIFVGTLLSLKKHLGEVSTLGTFTQAILKNLYRCCDVNGIKKESDIHTGSAFCIICESAKIQIRRFY